MKRRLPPRRLLAGAALCAALGGAVPAAAQIDVREFLQARRKSMGASAASLPLPRPFALPKSGQFDVIVELSHGASEPGLRLVRVADGFATVVLPPAELAALAERRPDWRLSFGPPRRVLLDKADDWVRASAFRAESGGSGAGAVIGIIDTGIDPAHGDFRDADGKSRIRWVIDFSRSPAGLHPELEQEYGCDTAASCAIFDDTDLDAMIAAGSGNLPGDTFGHGTHVASLAAGNGRSQSQPYYVGVAPEAQLIAARVSRAGDGSIFDADIVKAARFVFERAAELGLPAVANLSLGSDFGAHDGSSALERALAALVGPEHPGRAIVVAAGNSGTLYTTGNSRYPEPLGIHTEVHVPEHSVSRVPLLTLSSGRQTSAGTVVFVWIAFRPEDRVSVALDDEDGEWIPEIEPGEATTFHRGSYHATIYNGPQHSRSPVPDGTNSAVLVLEGSWPAEREFFIRLSGRGTAKLWVQSEGGLDPDGSAAALFPRAQKQGTINVPASHPELIAVGATLNRMLWIDHRNMPIEMEVHGALEMPALDSTAYFSAAGPNALGLMKPDIVAPGAYLIGAMSRLADPRKNGHIGVFAADGRCGTALEVECFVTDDAHGVSSGTSMAAPLVAGAAALLLERDPTLTQDELRALLQAGARPLEGVVLEAQQAGPGALDLLGALAVQSAVDTPIERDPGSASWLSLSASYAHPDRSWPLTGLVTLRDDAGLVADGFDPQRLALHASPAVILEPLTRLAPGSWRFQVAGLEGTGGETMTLEILFDGKTLLEQRVPIGVDRWAAENRASARGGCTTVASASRSPLESSGVLALLALCALRARRRTS